ncbi:MAG TPA: ISLre2 family transposase, partial [Gemmataceae bacterium]|nr:ISLre2 family transposase [Gemmataceae bacterium]
MDDRLGVTGFVSPQAKKLLSLAGASWSFAGAAGHLAEFCGLRTCDQTIRAVCYEEAGLLADWLHTDQAAGAGFAAAAGDIEFQTDGTMVNTWEGWRALRLGIFAKRQRGRPAAADTWDRRRLPPPHARVLFAGIETAAHFGPRVRRWAARLGVRDATQVTVVADGADWIW